MSDYTNGHHHPAFQDDFYEDDGEFFDEDEQGLTEEMDHLILMHRDAHFGGDFGVMLSYYQDENHIGVIPEIDPERIAFLADSEKKLGKDLAPFILTGPDAEKVAKARQAYIHLKGLYETEEPDSPLRLIADLILSEEEEPENEIEAVATEGSSIVPELIAILQSDDAYDPIFPGYGFAPYLAIICLGKIGDPKSIIPLFETLSKPIAFDEMAVVDAFEEIGESAKEFLLKIVRSRPLTQDNVNAAFALVAFSSDPSVAVAAFEELQDPEVAEKPLLRAYLVCNCESLGSTNYRDAFIRMSEDPKTPPGLREDMQDLIDEW